MAYPSASIKTPEELNSLDGLLLLCVKDDAIAELDARIPVELCCIHSSGFTELDQLRRKEKGVLWPLQTLIASKKISYTQLPIAYEASTEETETNILDLLRPTPAYAFKATSEERKHLHVAAVFASNFTNHLYSIAYSYLTEHGLDTKVLLPLILETAEKMNTLTPHEAQTGPAVRGDLAVLARQKELLAEHPQWQYLYTLFSEAIMAAKTKQP
jgi:predicted short-subunit dehydrogenase-like oxidoreductase (DUF2520 family)